MLDMGVEGRYPRKAYEKSLELDARRAESKAGLAVVLSREGRFERARSTFRHVLSLAPAHEGATRGLASLD